MLSALGDIALAHAFSQVLVEIQVREGNEKDPYCICINLVSFHKPYLCSLCPLEYLQLKLTWLDNLTQVVLELISSIYSANR